jgi:hypothetical protein
MGDLSEFVSRAVLHSDDGLALREQEKAGVDYGTGGRVARDVAKLEGRTLYEQLAANKAKVEEERLAKKMANFGAAVRVSSLR